MGYWLAAFGAAFAESFEQIGYVDLLITAFGGAAVIGLKAAPWFKKWNFEPKHAVFSETWRLVVAFVILFLVSSLVIIPGRMFEEEHVKAIELQAKLDSSNTKLMTANIALNKSEDRATRLSDDLNESKDSIHDNERIKKLDSEITNQKLQFSEVILKQQQQIDDLKDANTGLAPRNISADKHKLFVEISNGDEKIPVAVFISDNSAEAISYANQIRSLLDDSGYRDPSKSNVQSVMGSLASSSPTGLWVVVASDGKSNDAMNSLVNSLLAVGIAVGNLENKDNTLGLKPNESAILVVGK